MPAWETLFTAADVCSESCCSRGLAQGNKAGPEVFALLWGFSRRGAFKYLGQSDNYSSLPNYYLLVLVLPSHIPTHYCVLHSAMICCSLFAAGRSSSSIICNCSMIQGRICYQPLQPADLSKSSVLDPRIVILWTSHPSPNVSVAAVVNKGPFIASAQNVLRNFAYLSPDATWRIGCPRYLFPEALQIESSF